MREMICSIFASKKAKMFFQKTKVQWVTCLLCTFPRRSMTSLSKWLLFPVIISWVHIAFSWPIYYYSYKWHHEDWSSPKKTQTREVDEMKMKKKCSAICLISGSLPFSLYLSLPLSFSSPKFPDWINNVCTSNCRLFWSNKSIFHSMFPNLSSIVDRK